MDVPPRQKAKLPVSVCLKVNEFLAPDELPGVLHRLPQGGPITYPLFGGEGAAEFLAPFTPEDVCVGGPDQGGPDKQFDELGIAAQEALAAIETGMDAFVAVQLQQEEEREARGSASAPNASGQGSLRRSRTDNEMKELLKTLQVPHYVRRSNTHGQNNCLIDSILLALQDQQYVKPLEVDARAAVCSSIRRHLIEHHDVAPENPDGSQSYLSHEDSFDAICNQLRSEHPDIWFHGIDATRLPIIAVIYDRFHRRQLYDNSGAWAGEMEEVNAPVVSMPMSASENLPEVHIQLYCNTHDDTYGTPYHYEWISFKEEVSEEEEESGMDDDDDDENNPAPLPLLTSDEDNSNDGDNPAAPLPVSGVDNDDENKTDLPLPELPLRTQLSTRSSCVRPCVLKALLRRKTNEQRQTNGKQSISKHNESRAPCLVRA